MKCLLLDRQLYKWGFEKQLQKCISETKAIGIMEVLEGIYGAYQVEIRMR